jgi:hypothetical protein
LWAVLFQTGDSSGAGQEEFWNQYLNSSYSFLFGECNLAEL